MNKRKRQIIHAARTLFTEKGFQDTSIIDIISAANISKGTFYNHFTSKSECLIAILEETREEIVSQRYELAFHEDPSSREILEKQITLLAYVNRKRNLLQIFESLVGNKEPELKAVLEKQLISELEWLSNRLVDVYGEEIRHISYECAVQAIGMIQQSYRVYALAMKKFAPPEMVVNVVMDHVDALIPRLLETKNVMMTNEVISALQNKVQECTATQQDLLVQLQGFTDKLDQENRSAIEYTRFLIKELQTNTENLYIVEAVLQAFINIFRNTSHEAEVHEISVAYWRYLHSKRNSVNN